MYIFPYQISLALLLWLTNFQRWTLYQWDVSCNRWMHKAKPNTATAVITQNKWWWQNIKSTTATKCSWIMWGHQQSWTTSKATIHKATKIHPHQDPIIETGGTTRQTLLGRGPSTYFSSTEDVTAMDNLQNPHWGQEQWHKLLNLIFTLLPF
jgi:hypothetical protein